MNTYTTSAQDTPAVAGLVGGGFVATWESSAQDASSDGIFAQRFDAAGNPVDGEFRVNDGTSSTQQQPAIVALGTGGFVITWEDASSRDGNGWGVFGQQYDAQGHRLDSEFQVNTEFSSTQSQSAITSLANGGFGIGWTSASSGNAGDGSSNGIFYQLFGNALPTVTDVFASGDEDQPIVLDDDLFEAGFDDPDGQGLALIVIDVLPNQGTLTLNGSPVQIGEQITLEQLANNELVYLGFQDTNGTDDFGWRGSDGLVFSNLAQTFIDVAPVNDAPGLTLGDDATGDESFGNNFSRQLDLTDPDGDTYQIDIDWGDTQTSSFLTTDNTPNISHRFLDDGIYTVEVTVDDQAGEPNSVEVQSVVVTINNIAPVVSLSGDATVEENTPYTLTLGAPSDPGDDTITEYRIDWGDGTPVQVIAAGDLPASREVMHTFTDSDSVPNDYTIDVSVTDEDGDFSDVGTLPVTVAEPAEVITVDAGADFNVNEGTPFNLPVTFTDPTDQDPAGWSYVIDWGDGSADSVGPDFDRSFFGTHSYADEGVFTVTVTVTDDGSGQAPGVDTVEVTVDNLAPTINLGGAGSSPEGSLYTLTLTTFDPGDDTIESYAIDWGDGSAIENYTAATFPGNGQLQHLYEDGPDTVTISASVTDEDGTWNNTRDINITNVLPTVPLSGDDNVDEGAEYTLTIGTPTDPGQDTITNYTISWGDGTFSPSVSPGDVTHTYADGITNPTILLSVEDEDGQHANVSSKSITVNNVAPIVALGGDDAVDEGSTYSLTVGPVTDPGADTISSYTINWGDGSSDILTAVELANLGGVVEHVYAEGLSTPTITVDVVDEDDTHLTAGTKSITVNDVAPMVALSGADALNEGDTYSLTVGAVTDPGDDTVASYIINWGDGSSDTLTVAELAGLGGVVNHVYADGDASLDIVVDIVDEDGTHPGAGTKSITVNNVAPTVDLSGDPDVDEGSSYSLTIGAVTDPGTETIASYTVNWGDGSSETISAADLASQGGVVTHTYADGDATPTISVDITDEDGTHVDAGTLGIAVNNVAPTVDLSGDPDVDEGSSYSLTIGAVTDPGTETIASYTVNWGDGSSETISAADLASQGGVVTHTYADGDATPTISVDITDEDGTHVDAGTLGITVNNVAPTVDLSGDPDVDEGSSYSLTIGAVTDPGTETIASYTVNWGDGDSETISAADLASQGGVVTHTYADGDATPTITVDITDEDGTHTGAGTKDITVNNVAPDLVLSGASAINTGQLYTLTLGDVIDPGDDTVATYIIDWGDGTTDTVAAGDLPGNRELTHTYGVAANVTIAVDLVDEDGTFLDVDTLAVAVGTPPDGVSVSVGGDASIDEGETFARTISFSDGDDTGGDGWEYTIDWGDGSATETGTTTAMTFDISRVMADGDTSQTVSVTVTDLGDSGDTDTRTFDLTTNNVAPTVDLSGDPDVDEGSSYSLTIGAVTDPGTETIASYTVNWGDGSSETISAADLASQGGVVTHTYADGDATPTITVDITDEDGTHVDAGTLGITVNNVAPTVDLSGDPDVDEGTSYSLTIGAVTDPGTETIASYTVNWGDGSSETISAADLASQGGVVTHTYADGDATPTITVDITDEDGTHVDAGTLGITVNNVAPTVDLSGDPDVDEGTSYSLTIGAVTDPGTETIASYTVNWGDGSSETISAADLASQGGVVTHTYADGDATPTITVDITDEDGTHVDAGTLGIAVNNVAPTVDLSGDPDVDEGSSYSLTIGAVTDPGTETIASYTVNWGDGSSETISAADLASQGGVVTHTYADGDATPTITVDITDEDGTHVDAGTLGITVNNVAPTVDLSGDPDVDEGTSYSLTIGAVTDPGTETIASYTVNWGDGSSETISAADLASQGGVVTHTYADGDATPTISVDITDEDGTHVDAGTLGITVNNVAPTVDLSGDPDVDEGSSYSLTIGAVTDPGTETIASYTVNWGDGDSETISAADLASQGGVVTHTYADGDATPTITVDITDEDGTHTGAGTKDITVNNVAPDLVLSGASAINTGQLYTLTLGDVIDPGDDTVATYIIDWGDGTTDTVAAGDLPGNRELTHTYGVAANVTIAVDLVDEDGTFLDVDTLAVAVGTPPDGVSVSVGGDASIDEGETFARTISFSDGDDTGGDGWEYTIDWGDGSATETGTTTAMTFDISRVMADGDTSQTVSVTVTDLGDSGDTDTRTFDLTTNNVAPTVDLSGDPDVDEGSSYSLTIGAVTDPGTETIASYTVNWGDGSSETISAADLASQGGVVTHTYADGDATPTISVDITDEDGTHVDAGTLGITVNNVAPTVDLSGDPDVDEGTSYSLTIGAVTDPGTETIASYTVNWGDGSSETISAADLASQGGVVTHTYADGDATPTITVDITDEDGTHTGAGTKDITVNNVAPDLVLSGASAINTGQLYTLTLGDVIDPGDDTVATYIIDWGDGTTDTVAAGDLPGNRELTHTYGVAANVTIAVDLVDEDGTFLDVDTLPVTVGTPADGVSVSAGGDASIDEGETFTRTITFSDGNDAGGDGWDYSIDWDDGTAPETGSTTSMSFDISRVIADGDATQTVSVTVTDDAGDSDTKTFDLTVDNVAPSVDLAGDEQVDEGSSYSLTIGAVTDPGTETIASYTVNWGDGSSETISAADLASQGGVVTHTYADGDATPTISVDITDEDGTHTGAGTKALTVNNVAPELELSGNSSVDTGQLYTLNLGEVIDPGDDTVSQYTIDWGDGTSDTIDAGDLPASRELTHTYAAVASVTIAVDLVDEDGIYTDVDTLALAVGDIPTIRLGDVPDGASRREQRQAWTDRDVKIAHRGDYMDEGETWSRIKLLDRFADELRGGDLYEGDLGVSGQSLATGEVPQELEGSEALRFTLRDLATRVTLDLTSFYADDDGNGNHESVRIQAFDAAGDVVAELVASAENSDGQSTVSLDVDTGFMTLVVTSGVYDGGEFVFGGLADDAGGLGQAPSGSTGSDLLIEAIEFTYGDVAPPAAPLAPPAQAAVLATESEDQPEPETEKVDLSTFEFGFWDEDFLPY